MDKLFVKDDDMYILIARVFFYSSIIVCLNINNVHASMLLKEIFSEGMGYATSRRFISIINNNAYHYYTQNRQLSIETSKNIELDREQLGKNIMRENFDNFPCFKSQIKPFCYLLKDREETLGGIYGRTFMSVLQIKYLWVDSSVRQKGHGLELMKKAEKFGMENDCHTSIIDTTSAHFPLFYEKCGYILQYTQEGYNQGYKDYYFSKSLIKID